MKRKGAVKTNEVLHNDLTWRNCLSFSPLCIKTEAKEMIDLFGDDISESSIKMFKWVDTLTTSELQNITDYAMTDDDLWSQWRSTLIASIAIVYERSKETGEFV